MDAVQQYVVSFDGEQIGGAVAAAGVSADRISSDEMVDLVICFPLRQLGRWALYIWTYLCVSTYPEYPHRHHYTASYNHTDDDSDDEDDNSGGHRASSSRNNDYDYHYCSYCNQNSCGYDSSSSSD
ncbi:hypothetical protein OROGR_020974 [Orobanche gracilis]